MIIKGKFIIKRFRVQDRLDSNFSFFGSVKKLINTDHIPHL